MHKMYENGQNMYATMVKCMQDYVTVLVDFACKCLYMTKGVNHSYILNKKSVSIV